MRKLARKLEGALIRAKLAAERFTTEERGDTNFISIAIILVIVLAIAIVFITFGQALLPKMQEKIQEILDALS